MKKIGIIAIMLSVAIMMVLAAPAPKAQALTACDIPVIGIGCGVVEAAASPFFWMANLPKAKKASEVLPGTTVGEGVLNGVERIFVSSTLGWAGKGEREMFAKSNMAKVKPLATVVGNAAIGFGIGAAFPYDTMSHAATGAAIGGGAGVVEAAVEGATEK